MEAVRESGIAEGIACVYSPHTTCCVRVNEFEQGFLEDFAQLLRRLVPTEGYSRTTTSTGAPRTSAPRNGAGERPLALHGDAARHRRRVVPVREGELQLGTWQARASSSSWPQRDRRWLSPGRRHE